MLTFALGCLVGAIAGPMAVAAWKKWRGEQPAP